MLALLVPMPLMTPPALIGAGDLGWPQGALRRSTDRRRPFRNGEAVIIWQRRAPRVLLAGLAGERTRITRKWTPSQTAAVLRWRLP
jgi:hypothetical protein